MRQCSGVRPVALLFQLPMSHNLDFLFYAAVVAVIARTVTHEEICREPRECLQKYCEEPTHPLALRKLAYMLTCEFCFSFWLTWPLLTFVFQYRLLFDDWRGYVVSIFVTMAAANVYMSLFNLLRVDLRKEKVLAEHIERRRSA